MTFNGTSTGSAPIIVEITQGVNDLTGGLVGLFLLIMVFGMVYYRNRYEPTREALAGAAWVTTLVAVLLRVLGLFDDWYLGICIVLAVGSLIMLVNRS